MKICIETGDKDEFLRPPEDDTWIIMMWVLVIMGLIPIVIILFIASRYLNIHSPLLFLGLTFTDIAICAYITWQDRKNYIKEHGGI